MRKSDCNPACRNIPLGGALENGVVTLPRARGFTLIELLVTVAVMVILATVAVPGFQNLLQTNRQTADFNDILSGLHYARSEAVKRREPVSAAVTFDTAEGWQVNVTRAEGGGTLLLRQIKARDNNISVTPNTIVFNSLGRRHTCDTDPDTCLITVAGNDIIVDPSGHIGRHTE
ncbi:GspH/FimT family pseudopilin [Halomonas sp.]|uniref:GspH/FimT family pseudopilin n=1 Tax=Halomonas sp. TaxID=1486246 RepID=UPI00384B6366